MWSVICCSLGKQAIFKSALKILLFSLAFKTFVIPIYVVFTSHCCCFDFLFQILIISFALNSCVSFICFSHSFVQHFGQFLLFFKVLYGVSRVGLGRSGMCSFKAVTFQLTTTRTVLELEDCRFGSSLLLSYVDVSLGKALNPKLRTDRHISVLMCAL